MKPFAPIVLLTQILCYWLKKLSSIWLKQTRVIYKQLEYKYLDINMSLLSSQFLIKCLHKQRHPLCILIPRLPLEQLHHLIYAPLNVLHALMLINIVHLQLFLLLLLITLHLFLHLHLSILLLLQHILQLRLFAPRRRRLRLEHHRRVELLVRAHKRRVHVLVDQVVCFKLGGVQLELLLDLLELDVGKVGLHFEVEGGVGVHNEGPDAVLLTLVSIGHEEELGEKVLFGLGRHDHGG